MKGKIIQIAACGVDNVQGTQCNALLYALCEDGRLFGICNNSEEWFQLPPVPTHDEYESKTIDFVDYGVITGYNGTIQET